MKKLFLLLTGIFFLTCSGIVNAQVAINATGDAADGSAMLDVSSTGKGLLVPRVTSAQMNSFSSKSDGLLVYNTDQECFYYYSTSDLNWHSFVVSGISGTFQIGSSSNYVQIGTDGTVTLAGNATAWNDFVVSPTTAKNNGTATPGWTQFFATRIYAYHFLDGNLEQYSGKNLSS